MQLPQEKLEKILLKTKILDRNKLDKIKTIAEKNNISVYNALIAEDVIERNRLNQTIASSLGVNYIDLDKEKISKEDLFSLPEIMAKEHLAIVFKKEKNKIHLAMNNPGDNKLIELVKTKTKCDVIPYFTDENSLKNAISQYNQGSASLQSLLNSINNKGETITGEDIPIIQIVHKILESAFENKASDIHIEPHEKNTLIRFRIDGLLHDVIEIPSNLHDLIVTRIKIMARIRTDEHRAAQDGKLKFITKGESVDVRVSIVPIIYGEKVVLRLLSERITQHDMEMLGLRDANLEKVKINIQKPWGMILSTGPTGCGKTTTLYSILKKLNIREVNISTIEDPVEYDIEGINQIQVNPKTNLTFSMGLRSLVRQDPDIILVGEIRDEETAKIALNSALTGHLVLSTIHTNDAATTLPRLMDMGIQPFLVASTVNLIIAQRLVRKICPDCKTKTKLDAKTLDLIEKQFSKEIIEKNNLTKPGTMLWHGQGCENCKSTGYKGRIGIFEVMEMNDEIKKLIMMKSDAATIKQKAETQGMTTMIEDGMIKALEGLTTIEEILRVIKE